MKTNRIIYCLILTAVLITICIYGGLIPYTLFFSVLLIPLISFTYLLWCYISVRTNIRMDKHMMIKGDLGEFFVDVTNEKKSFIPFVDITIACYNGFYGKEEKFPTFSLLPGEKKMHKLNLSLLYCGFYRIRIEKIELMDSLGIFKLKFKDSESKTFMVYPNTVFLENIMLNSNDINDFTASVNMLNEDVSSFSDVRDYRHGDTLNRIHWIQTARIGHMMVKNYDNIAKTTISVIIDLRNSIYQDIRDVILKDAIICSLASFLDYCMKNDIPIRISYHNGQEAITKRINSNLYEEEYFSFIGDMHFDSGISPYDLLKEIEETKEISSDAITTTVIFTYNFNADTLEFFLNDSQSNNVILMYPMAQAEAEEILNARKILKDKGVKMFAISFNDTNDMQTNVKQE